MSVKYLRPIAAILAVLALAGPASLSAMAGLCVDAASPDCCCRKAAEPAAAPSCHAAPEPEPEASVCDCGPGHGDSTLPGAVSRVATADAANLALPGEAPETPEAFGHTSMFSGVPPASQVATPTYLIHCAIRC